MARRLHSDVNTGMKTMVCPKCRNNLVSAMTARPLCQLCGWKDTSKPETVSAKDFSPKFTKSSKAKYKT